jgi:hypothetical protein
MGRQTAAGDLSADLADRSKYRWVVVAVVFGP